MRKIKIAVVMLESPKMTKDGPVYDDKMKIVMVNDTPLTTGKMLNELVWGDTKFSASEGAAGCLERWGEVLDEAEVGSEHEMSESDHEQISEKLKEFVQKDASGKVTGSKNVRRIRNLANMFIFTPKEKGAPPKSLEKREAVEAAATNHAEAAAATA